MKNYIFFLVLFLSIQYTKGQDNLLTDEEASFEFEFSPDGNQCEFCMKDASQNADPPDKFINTGRWRAIQNSPQIKQGGIGFAPPSKRDQKIAYLEGGNTTQANYAEGIFFDFNFTNDRYYSFSVYAYSGSRLTISLTTGLVNNDNGNGTQGGNVFSQPPTTELILLNDYTVPNTGNWELIEIKNFIPNGYNQISIITSTVTNSEAFLDDAFLTQSCCIYEKSYQNITNPPNTYVTSFISAGKYAVTPFSNVGPVIINRPFTTIWKAGMYDSLDSKVKGRIVFVDGFKSGKDFKAQIRDCLNSPVELTLDYSIGASSGGNPCVITITGSTCFGSGRYSFTGTDITHGMLINSIVASGSGALITVAPTEETIYEITVTDLVTGLTSTKRITIGKCGCIPAKKPDDVNFINKICGESSVDDCFKIGMNLPLNATYTWLDQDYMSDPENSVTTVCVPKTLGGTGILVYRLVSQSPGCPAETTEFLIKYKRVPTNDCYFYSGFWGPSSLNEANELTIGADISLDVDEIWVELSGNTGLIYTSPIYVRGVDFSTESQYFLWNNVFGSAVEDGNNYTAIIYYKCLCSDVVNIGRIIVTNFN